MGWFGIYMLFNLSFNLLFYYLTKRMSAVWATIATTLCLDLTNIFSQFSFLMGAGAQLMTFCMWLGTIIASVALWVYNLEKETDKRGRDVWVTNRAETPEASEASSENSDAESKSDADDIETAASEQENRSEPAVADDSSVNDDFVDLEAPHKPSPEL